MRAALLPRLFRCRLLITPTVQRTFSSARTAQPAPDPAAPQTPTSERGLPNLIYPSSPSQSHSDLASFLSYAARTNLDPASTVYVGTHFEYTACAALARLGFSLRRVGGTSDCGIDLLGTWELPGELLLPAALAPVAFRILAQCKAVQRPGPHLVRELEGAFAAAPPGWRARSDVMGQGVMGLLVTQKSATPGIRAALARSRWPMAFVACSREGRVAQLLWNRMAEENGLEGLGVGTRYTAEGKELVLNWMGRYLPIVGKEAELAVRKRGEAETEAEG